MELLFPLELKNNDFALVDGDDKVRSRILIFLTTLKGELMWNLSRGLPFYLFESKDNFSRDIATIEAELSVEIPYANFRVTGSIDDEGLITLHINWYSSNSQDNIDIQFNLG